jgi:hypothetical protein
MAANEPYRQTSFLWWGAEDLAGWRDNTEQLNGLLADGWRFVQAATPSGLPAPVGKRLLLVLLERGTDPRLGLGQVMDFGAVP